MAKLDLSCRRISITAATVFNVMATCFRGWRFMVGGAAFFVTLLVAGCEFLDLRDDLQELEKLPTISGRIIETEKTEGQVVLAVIKDEFRRDHLFEVRVIDPAFFEIKLPSGKYFLFAYKDESRDYQYQPEEPAAFFGDPTPLNLTDGVKRTELQITLKRNLTLPAGAYQRQRGDATNASELPFLWAGRKNVGALVTLDDPRFEREVGSMGLWQPLRFTLDPGPGVYFLESYSARKKPVLFIHGIGGTPQDWRSIIDSLDRRRFQPWVFTYASGLPLETNAQYLLSAIRQIRKQYRIHSVSLVAHSMGGLIAQAFIDRHDPGEAQYLDLLITISTPWQGHSAAQLGVDISPIAAPVWIDMAPSSTFLAKLKEVKLPSNVEFQLIFGYGGRSLLGGSASDGTVTVASQLDPDAQSRAKRIYGFDAGHVDILSREDAKNIILSLLAAKSN